MKDEDLNQILDTVDRDSNGDKPIPYIGWLWKTIDFTQPISIAVIPKEVIHTNYHYVGLVFDNLWKYPEYKLSNEEISQLRDLLEKYAISNTRANSIEIRNFLNDTLTIRTAIVSLCDKWPKKEPK
jgi:hypothetical protein